MNIDPEKLLEPVALFHAADDQDYAVTGLEIAVKDLRNSTTALLKVVDPEGYRTYRRIKYRHGDNPDLQTRRMAYLFAFDALLQAGYSMPGL